ncbi:MAG: response regulator [Myxococcota bacterium]
MTQLVTQGGVGGGPLPVHGRRGSVEHRQDTTLRVLLVEDEPADADLVASALSNMGERPVQVERAIRLRDALARVISDPPDLVLLDLRLPDAQGLETLDRVLAVGADVPVVVLTGSSDGRTAAEAVQRGAQDYLGKDVLLHGDLLLRSIRHSLERHRLLKEARRQSRIASAAEAELRRLVQGNVDGMVVIDSGEVVLFANPAAERLLGAPEDGLLGARLPLPDGWMHQNEIEVPVARGRSFTVELRTAPIEWNGSPARLVSLRDVSERKAAEELRQRLLHADRLRSIGQLAAGVAHEINNPAAFITVNQEALLGQVDRLSGAFDAVHDMVASWGAAPLQELEGVLRDRHVRRELAGMRAVLNENRDGLERIVAIVRSLRGFARVEQGQMEHVHVDELIEDACTMVHNEIRHRAVLRKELGGPPPLVGDRGRLTQVMVNLLVNAAHAIDEGEAGRNLIIVRSRLAQGQITIEVEDTGCGIPEEQLDRIFEPFFTTKGRDEGTGLGLALSAEIVRQHGGVLHVESEVGVGTRFIITLPAETGLQLTGRHTAGPTPLPAGQHHRVLIIDDEPVLLRGLRRMLGRQHEVVTAEGGEEALRILERDRAFDLVVCDLMMPTVDGPAVHAWIRREAEELLDRIVYMSGGAFTDRARDFVERTGVRVVDKPLSKKELEKLMTERE